VSCARAKCLYGTVPAGLSELNPRVATNQPPKSKHAWSVGVGVGAGILGALLVALKYVLRPPTKRRVPDTISPEVFATKVLHTSLGQVVYHESGRGQPLVFVHNVGLGCSSYEWAKVYPEFAARYRVLALDLAGFGESARPAVRFTAAEYARMLAEFLRALEWDQAPILVASGLSAGFCVHLAGQHPELISRLILHMPNGTGEFGGWRPSFFSKLLYRTPLLARFLYRNHVSTKSSVASWLRKIAASDAATVTDEMIDVFATCAQQPAAEYAALAWLNGQLGFDFETRWRALPLPVALLWGEAEFTEPENRAFRLHRLLPASTLTTLPGAGTFAALEAPDAMVAALNEQLRSDLRVLKAG
jgi:pimeloyl-ACP methyl ester carboxylesterase